MICFDGFQLQGAMNVFFEVNCGSFHERRIASKRQNFEKSSWGSRLEPRRTAGNTWRFCLNTWRHQEKPLRQPKPKAGNQNGPFGPSCAKTPSSPVSSDRQDPWSSAMVRDHWLFGVSSNSRTAWVRKLTAFTSSSISCAHAAMPFGKLPAIPRRQGFLLM